MRSMPGVVFEGIAKRRFDLALRMIGHWQVPRNLGLTDSRRQRSIKCRKKYWAMLNSNICCSNDRIELCRSTLPTPATLRAEFGRDFRGSTEAAAMARNGLLTILLTLGLAACSGGGSPTSGIGGG